MSGAVRTGYKQTEVGVIPEDWDIANLASMAAFITSGSRGWARYYADRGALFVRSQNVRDGRLDFADTQFVSAPNGAEGDRTRLGRNDLLITITGNSVGNVALVEQDLGEAYISQHVGLVRLAEPSCGQYVCRFLSPGSPGNVQIWASQSGQSKPGLSLKNLQEFLVVLPPTSEQHAIATTLSDLDALLSKLDALIAKKRDLKQAAMQQLLTGQTRLPGFSGEWEVKRLGDVADLLKGSGLSKGVCHVSGRRKCILYGELFTTYGQVIGEVVGRTNSPDGRESVFGDVLIPGSTTTDGIDLATASALLEDGIALGGDINIVRCKSNREFDASFLANYLTTVKKQVIAERAQGTTIVHLYGRDLADLIVDRPALEEQIAIATVLSDIDAELTALEVRSNKTRALKQGMMQELLTGSVRLV